MTVCFRCAAAIWLASAMLVLGPGAAPAAGETVSVPRAVGGITRILDQVDQEGGMLIGAGLRPLVLDSEGRVVAVATDLFGAVVDGCMREGHVLASHRDHGLVFYRMDSASRRLVPFGEWRASGDYAVACQGETAVAIGGHDREVVVFPAGSTAPEAMWRQSIGNDIVSILDIGVPGATVRKRTPSRRGDFPP
jgi:hypothetical protein